MNRTSVLQRKLIYLVVLVAMLFPLWRLGQPAGGGSDVGGRLTEMRHDFNIAESDLGEISPASQTMKLASLGLRGVAATLLWNKTHEYRVTHEWDRLKAAVNNIALLQPHSDKVWEFHAHNLTYNVSTEFDDYRQRYEMVREGTEFLQRGVRQNRNATRLIWYTGWFYGSKMGMSDEKEQFRRLFADDKVLHDNLIEENIPVDSLEARGPLGKPDNWLVGRLWLNKGYDLVDTGVKIRRQTPLNFYETGPKWRIKHAESIEREGILDDRAQTRWQMASEDWKAFGDRSVPTTSPFTIKLGHLDDLKRRKEARLEEFKSLIGQPYTEAEEKNFAELPPNIVEIWNKPADERSVVEQELYEKAREGIRPNLDMLAKQSDPDVRLRAIEIVDELRDIDARIQKTRGYRTQINYPYWETLAKAEQEERTVRARKLVYDAEQANANADIDTAIELYEQAFEIWADIFDDYPILTIDDTADDLIESIRRYMVAIDSEEFSDDFPLLAFVEMKSIESGFTTGADYIELRDRMQEEIEQRRQEENPSDPESDSAKPESNDSESKSESADAAPDSPNAAPDGPDAESASPDAEPASEDGDADAASAKDDNAPAAESTEQASTEQASNEQGDDASAIDETDEDDSAESTPSDSGEAPSETAGSDD